MLKDMTVDEIFERFLNNELEEEVTIMLLELKKKWANRKINKGKDLIEKTQIVNKEEPDISSDSEDKRLEDEHELASDYLGVIQTKDFEIQKNDHRIHLDMKDVDISRIYLALKYCKLTDVSAPMFALHFTNKKGTNVSPYFCNNEGDTTESSIELIRAIDEIGKIERQKQSE